MTRRRRRTIQVDLETAARRPSADTAVPDPVMTLADAHAFLALVARALKAAVETLEAGKPIEPGSDTAMLLALAYVSGQRGVVPRG